MSETIGYLLNDSARLFRRAFNARTRDTGITALQYSLDGGANWTVITGVSQTNALLLSGPMATLTFLPFIVSSSVMTLTALDFLGFGLPPGSPSLGELLAQAKANVQAPWLGLTGFFSVAIMLSLLIFIGEAARDAFDPRKTFR